MKGTGLSPYVKPHNQMRKKSRNLGRGCGSFVLDSQQKTFERVRVEFFAGDGYAT
jgi:hypothetical protein